MSGLHSFLRINAAADKPLRFFFSIFSKNKKTQPKVFRALTCHYLGQDVSLKTKDINKM